MPFIKKIQFPESSVLSFFFFKKNIFLTHFLAFLSTELMVSLEIKSCIFFFQWRGWFDEHSVKTRGTMSAEIDAQTVVNQLRDLAADPLNRRAIVEDQGCLPGLILFFDHPNPQVVYSALLVSTIQAFLIYHFFHKRDIWFHRFISVFSCTTMQREKLFI